MIHSIIMMHTETGIAIDQEGHQEVVRPPLFNQALPVHNYHSE